MNKYICVECDSQVTKKPVKETQSLGVWNCQNCGKAKTKIKVVHSK